MASFKNHLNFNWKTYHEFIVFIARLCNLVVNEKYSQSAVFGQHLKKFFLVYYNHKKINYYNK